MPKQNKKLFFNSILHSPRRQYARLHVVQRRLQLARADRASLRIEHLDAEEMVA
jgi:hypothetical protein